jgi:hypothetical protein
VAEELERDTVPCAWRALAEEFVLETGDAGLFTLRDEEIVVDLATDWGVVTTELVLDKALAGVVEAVCVLVMELGRDTKENESLLFEVVLVDAEEATEGVLSTFTGRDPAVRTVETESDLDTETVDDLGLEPDLILGSGSSR